MQGKRKLLLQDAEPIFLYQDTDTAYPRTLVPIYFIHDLSSLFCTNPLCFCQRGKRAVQSLYGSVEEGELLLAQLTADNEIGAQDMTQKNETDQPDRLVVSTVYIDLINDIPEECQLYGHTWQTTGHPDVQECVLCHIRGYCPKCTSLPPAGAQPFTCTTHARQRQVRH